ncbi:MAG: YfiR family protein [Bacteroidales bacterium]|nr:YfiR family protein [Bacteroidales bacterium]
MRKIFIGLLMVFSTSIIVKSQIYEQQAMFIYNFSRLIKWPSASNDGDFVIGIVGNNNMYTSMQEYMTSKKVGAQKIVVKKYNTPEDILPCEILVVAADKKSKMPQIMSKIQGMNILVIGENESLLDSGASIAFTVVDNKLKFQLNMESASKRNLVVSKSLMDMSYSN